MKQAEITKLSPDELTQKLAELQTKHAELRSMHSMSPLDNPAEITNTRRAIARLKTALNSK